LAPLSLQSGVSRRWPHLPDRRITMKRLHPDPLVTFPLTQSLTLTLTLTPSPSHSLTFHPLPFRTSILTLTPPLLLPSPSPSPSPPHSTGCWHRSRLHIFCFCKVRRHASFRNTPDRTASVASRLLSQSHTLSKAVATSTPTYAPRRAGDKGAFQRLERGELALEEFFPIFTQELAENGVFLNFRVWRIIIMCLGYCVESKGSWSTAPCNQSFWFVTRSGS